MYQPVRHFVRTLCPHFPDLPPRSVIDSILEKSKRKISNIYGTIISLKTMTLNTIRAAWEEELGMEISDQVWIAALDRLNDTTTCARLSLIQFKILHCIHYSKAKLAKIYPDVDKQCDPCHLDKSDTYTYCILVLSQFEEVLVSDILDFI